MTVRDRSQPSGHDANAESTGSSPEQLTAFQLLNSLLRHRRAILLAALVGAFFLVTSTLLEAPHYTSTASFTPESRAVEASRLSGLASQIGIQVPTGEAGQSPQFYADLLVGRALLRETVLTKYELNEKSNRPDAQPGRGNLVDFLEVEAETRPLAVANAIDALRERISVSGDPETAVVELSVTTRWPELSQQVADRMLELVNDFNLERRQTQAAAEREFVENQVARAESALHAVEDSLQKFLEQNRRYENSPELRFEYERLQRRVRLRQQVYTSLSESYQQAKIEEVRNTPVITVVEPPELSARPEPRRLGLRGVLGLVLGGMMGVIWAFGREMMATTRQRDPDHYAEYERLKREMRMELRDLWRQLRSVWE